MSAFGPQGAVVTPAELPEKATGWTKRQSLHMSVEGGGIGVYTVRNPEGEVMPFGWQYNTSPDGLTGFTLEGVEGVLTWAELRAHWPVYLASKVAK